MSAEPDLTAEHVGPAVVWVARTAAGVKYLESLPERFRSPVVVVNGGRETPAGRSRFDPATAALMTCPARQTELTRDATAAGLTVVAR